MQIVHHVYSNGIECDEREFAVGDKVWYILGSIIVRCTITEIDDYFRKQNPDAYLFYELDEPVGHSVGADDLYLDMPELLATISPEDFSSKLSRTRTLEIVRDSCIMFIARTHAGDFGLKKKFSDDEIRQKVPEVFEYFKAYLSPKQYGFDWFYLKDAI